MTIRTTARAPTAGVRTHAKVVVVLAAAGAAIGLAALQGCGSAHPGPAPPSAPPPPPVRLSNPLDNVGTAGNTLAVKIDNVGARVQAIQHGLAQADIVYWIEVEGGQSRFLAVYDANHLPALVGPVRSARQTDIPLLQQYGHLDLAYSGAISGLVPLLNRADLQNVTPFTDPGAFTNHAIDPTFIDPHRILARFPSVPARSPGFEFGAAPGGGSALGSMTWHLPAAAIGVRFDGSTYDVAVDGRPAWSGTATVVVQHLSIVPGAFTDFNAGHPDNEVFTQTTGSGQADVLRDGKEWTVNWSRPDPAAGTSFTLPDGSVMPFATGPVLVVMVP
ncbi:DUF3048 domain-containing protein [Kitasatospora aureofaciens]|uniref:DUF3048 domain-containing protein n=1 Tax=Kitasatospora aureofaciens TaxID=1894 RepID=UPI001C48D71E|nr:DUF3048 domain-containing protein [Kitasatospora aureofaciens]MBV6696752.1 DUF3048 domain-containing protein [Kitasatospora aureofaciens]